MTSQEHNPVSAKDIEARRLVIEQPELAQRLTNEGVSALVVDLALGDVEPSFKPNEVDQILDLTPPKE